MAETFYSALGVAANADVEQIRDAYRDRIKESHPDVSDDPDAPRTFKRLTTARDVLIDADERARYDRLGHATYVTRHVETSVWAVPERQGRADSPGGGSRSGSRADARSRRGTSRRADAGGSGHERHRRSDTGDYDRAAWLGEDWDGPRERSQWDQSPGPRRGAGGRGNPSAREARWVGSPGWSRGDGDRAPGDDSRREGGPATASRSVGSETDSVGVSSDRTRGDTAGSGPRGSPDDGGAGPAATDAASTDPARGVGRSDGGTRRARASASGGGGAWQQASPAYQYRPSSVSTDTGSVLRSIGGTVRDIWPWLIIHAVLFVSSIAMAWYMYVGTAGLGQISVPAVAFGVLLVGLVIFLSVLHIVSLAYA